MSEHQDRDKMVEDTWRMFLTEGRNTKEFSIVTYSPYCHPTHVVGFVTLHSTALAERS